MERIGYWIALISIILIASCVTPLLLYIAFGPEDGNPVGLGLLMVFGTPVFGTTAVLGGTIWLIGKCRGRKHTD